MKRNQIWAIASKVLAVAAVTLMGLVLAPGASAEGRYKILHKFSGADGSEPMGALVFDTAGNLYGTTNVGGCCGNGTVFKLAPQADGSWTQTSSN